MSHIAGGTRKPRPHPLYPVLPVGSVCANDPVNGVDPLGLAEAGQPAWGPYPILYATKLSDHLWVHFANTPSVVANTAEAAALQPIRGIPAVIELADDAASDWLIRHRVIDRSLGEGLDDLAGVGVANPVEAALAADVFAHAASCAGAALRSRLAARTAEAIALAEMEVALPEFGVGAARAGEFSVPAGGGLILTVKEPRILSETALSPEELAYLLKNFTIKKRAIERAAARGELVWSPGTDAVRISELQQAYRAEVAARFRRMYGVDVDAAKLALLNADHPVDLVVGGSATQLLKMLSESINKSVGASLLQAGRRAGLSPGDAIDAVEFVPR